MSIKDFLGRSNLKMKKRTIETLQRRRIQIEKSYKIFKKKKCPTLTNKVFMSNKLGRVAVRM